jgi:AcrR family transcriptional regulator
MSKALENYNNKREKIITSGRALFLSKGYAETSMDEVAKHAEVTKQTVYRYFASKTELFAEIIAQVNRENTPYEFGDMSPEMELARFGAQFISLHIEKERMELYRIMLSETREGSEIGMLFKNLLQDVRKRPLADYLEEMLGIRDAEKSADLLCAMFLSLRTPLLMNTGKRPETSGIISHAENCVKIFLHGIKEI